MPAEEELLSKQMPHSTEAEYAVLGSILINSNCLPALVEKLKPEDFYLPQNQVIFQTIYRMFSLSQTIDPVTVLNQMRQDGTYQEGTTREYFFQLMQFTPTTENVSEYADMVKDCSILRQIGDAAAAMTDMVMGGQGTSSEVLEAAEQRIYAIRQGKSAQGLHHITSVMHEVYERLAELAASDSAVPGLSTGLPDVDTVISGLNKSDLILLAARPGMGKTSLALNILLYAGKHSGKACVFFSLEMSREQLAMRLLSNESFVDNKKLTTGRLTDEDWEKVALATSALNHSNILIDDNPYLLMTSAGGKNQYAGESRQQVVSDISRALKIMAKELNVPVICLSQLSRANENRENKRPRLSDLRESGAIEQDADIVMFIYRDDYYNQDSENHNQAECIVAKNRHGELATVPLQWLPEFTTFSSVDWKHQEP